MSLQIFISETMGCESISTIALFYDGSQHGVFRLAQLSARLSCDCARSHFHGTGTSPLPLTAALPFIKNGRETAENQLRSLISWHLVL